ncbi:hypothetical protein L6270_02470 [Candidatus Parcubacteria bacterium]|nr:hypothetical protein [Patescibacteria group bacterium]MBU4309522.1 hypothetical protein [Patescibacteria group bacterium]MBU4432368.1 hypothetical protein [Patescibacteria group bacterium]MBU4577228.1 hypothetical protein [Patescibacteria group bacterium]MCG2696874.1 hypothetical protein [Candidatus Parcubacteria bacterium]
MKIKSKKGILLSFFALSMVGAYFFVSNSGKFHLFQGAQAVGGFPYQIGLTTVTVIPCFTTGYPPLCEGGTLCLTKDAASCTLYSDVSGSPAGGMGMNALFLNTSIAQAGLTSGGQLIAGGMSNVLMDNGVLASTAGCAGCMAKANKVDKIKEVFDYVIASFK